ncbi:GGDEF domain-containing protein [Pseudotabrizicola sp. L79]|uniref:GGDEF domain-containing protein n=1 Tax=Pseudotabrizicola sp. L79 TaxID=3118402 RepID=UPI002F93DE7A
MTADITVSGRALDRLMPLHLHLDAQGQIRRAGPTLIHILGQIKGQSVFDLFHITRPTGLMQMAALLRHAGEQLTLSPRLQPAAAWRGQIVPVKDGGAILNLSFGLNVIEAVRQHALTAADFAPTDLAVEMLYLVEAKNAVLDEFRRLSLRLEGARSEAEEQSLTDPLTGLRNRRALDLALGRACAGRQAFGLMHLDLDKFKQVNDTLGHAAGDHILRQVAQTLRAETRAGDTVARVGGDEFVILLPAMTDQAALMALAGRLVARLGRPMDWDGAPCQIGASIGITSSQMQDRPDPAHLLHQADLALYAAKNAGRGQARLAQASDGMPPEGAPAQATPAA